MYGVGKVKLHTNFQVDSKNTNLVENVKEIN
jgi:hypothetical protein